MVCNCNGDIDDSYVMTGEWVNEHCIHDLIELIGDLAISAFSGMITFYLCEASKLDQILTAAIVGMAGHMGSRTIFLVEVFIQERIFPGTDGKPEQKQPPENHYG